MSAISTSRAQKRPWTEHPAHESDRELPLAPREGWLTLLALVVMIGSVAVAMDDATWAGLGPGGRESQTKFLPVAALLSVLLGAWLAKRPMRPMYAHLISAFAGGIFLLYAIAGSISRAPGLVSKLHELNLSVSTFVQQVFVEDTRSNETSVFLLILGALIWGAGHFAAFNVFRRHQAAPGIVLAGLIMLINVSITVHEQYLHLIVFVLAAMLLVMRLNLFEQMGEWRSRGMRELGDISGSFLRNGAVMVALAIGASIVLAANASSAPLSRAWNNFDDQLLEIGYGVNRWLGGVSGPARGPNVLITPTQRMQDVWQSSPEEVFTASISDNEGRRWRGGTYDSFDGASWKQTGSEAVLVETGKDLLEQSVEHQVEGTDWEAVTATVTPANLGSDVFFAPAQAIRVDQPAALITSGAQGPFVAGKLANGIQQGVPYTVEAQVRRATNGRLQLTANELAVSGTKYPDWVNRYLEIAPGSVGELVEETAKTIYNGLPKDKRDPYHVAEAVQDYLYSRGGFTYETNLSGECGPNQKIDCFLTIKKGFCVYFAGAMVMLLRELGVPSRYVVGYLPGQEQADHTFRVEGSASHAWVEVYFNGHGWLEFDPTPGNFPNGQTATHLPEGAPLSSASPIPGAPSQAPVDPVCEGDRLSRACLDQQLPPASTQTPTGGGPNIPLFVGLGFLALLAAALALAVFLFRRIPSSEPELAYSGISRLAARLGYGPRPSQTVYEFADRLGELVPVAAGDVHLIATAKVEATYARRRPEEGTLNLIGAAYRRARLGLLRLVVRKPRSMRPRRRSGGPAA